MGNTLGDCQKNRTNHQLHHHHHHVSNDDADDCCAICLEPTTTKTTTTTCQHTFHTACLTTWCRHKDTCPLCRHRLATATAAAATPFGPYVIGRKYNIEFRYASNFESRTVYYNGTLSDILPPNPHGNTCYRFTFSTPSLMYYFFDNIYNFVAAD